jgi:hypothetical protein
MNQKLRAWMTLQESLKWNYENWRVWDNYMIVSTDVSKFHEVCYFPILFYVTSENCTVVTYQVGHDLRNMNSDIVKNWL